MGSGDGWLKRAEAADLVCCAELAESSAESFHIKKLK